MQGVNIYWEQDQDLVDEEAHEPPELIKVELSLQQTHHYEMEHWEKYADYYTSEGDLHIMMGLFQPRCLHH